MNFGSTYIYTFIVSKNSNKNMYMFIYTNNGVYYAFLPKSTFF